MTSLSTASAVGERPDPQLQLVLRRAELAALIERFAVTDGAHPTAVPGLTLFRTSRVGEPMHSSCGPAFCVLVQGSKRVLLGDELFVYDSSSHLVVSQDLPVTGQVLDATPEAPYLALRLDIDPAEIATLMLGTAHPKAAEAAARGIFTGETRIELLDAVLRMTRLLDAGDDIAALAPLVIREIFYRLLKGENGWRLAQLATANSQSRRIGRAIAWLRARIAMPLKLEDMAREAHMSVSSLHHHFKAVTAMSPLQYQKQLRLQEARRLLFNGMVDAAAAGYRVGYESPSQFSREYSRMFGAPPARDLRRFRHGELGGRL
ncbi:AraC family transcriptional regulator [Variovorax paradoxus]|nr:AraC family transcriptional regulator [Variovorax paradoxus]